MKPQIETPLLTAQELFTVDIKKQSFHDSILHKHDMYELTYLPKVQALRYIGDSVKETNEDELVLLGPNLMHCWHIINSNFAEISALVIYIDKAFLENEFFKQVEFTRFRQILNLSDRGVKFNADLQGKLVKQMRQMLHKKGLARLIQLLEVFETISQFREQDLQLMASANYKAINKENEQELISQVINFIQQNYTQPITLSEVADLAHLSTSAFCRYFKRCTGKTFLDFVKEVRISHACHLLQNNKKPVSEIGFLCGYNNMANFNRQFRQITQMSPSEYQKLYTLTS